MPSSSIIFKAWSPSHASLHPHPTSQACRPPTIITPKHAITFSITPQTCLPPPHHDPRIPSSSSPRPKNSFLLFTTTQACLSSPSYRKDACLPISSMSSPTSHFCLLSHNKAYFPFPLPSSSAFLHLKHANSNHPAQPKNTFLPLQSHACLSPTSYHEKENCLVLCIPFSIPMFPNLPLPHHFPSMHSCLPHHTQSMPFPYTIPCVPTFPCHHK